MDKRIEFSCTDMRSMPPLRQSTPTSAAVLSANLPSKFNCLEKSVTEQSPLTWQVLTNMVDFLRVLTIATWSICVRLVSQYLHTTPCSLCFLPAFFLASKQINSPENGNTREYSQRSCTVELSDILQRTTESEFDTPSRTSSLIQVNQQTTTAILNWF